MVEIDMKSPLIRQNGNSSIAQQATLELNNYIATFDIFQGCELASYDLF